MVISHILGAAVVVFVGYSTACVKWMIVDPPIIFGKTAQLLCSLVTPNISFDTHPVTSWIGRKDYSILTINGGTADPRKYAEIRKWRGGKFQSILQIYNFDEMDVNVDYECSIGDNVNRTRLSLTPDKFEYLPDKDNTRVLTHFRNGYLNVIVKIIKVYPIPKCTIMFNENLISRGLTTKTGVNGMFYIVVEEVEHSFDVCSGQLIVTCVVGKTEIPIHQEIFNRCTKTKEESPDYIGNLNIPIITGVLLFGILSFGIVCLARYRQLQKGRLFRGKDQRSLKRHAKESPSQLTIAHKLVPTHDI